VGPWTAPLRMPFPHGKWWKGRSSTTVYPRLAAHEREFLRDFIGSHLAYIQNPNLQLPELLGTFFHTFTFFFDHALSSGYPHYLFVLNLLPLPTENLKNYLDILITLWHNVCGRKVYVI
jgi:hypothetical protein